MKRVNLPRFSIYRLMQILALSLLISACSYKAPTSVSPAHNVYSSYEDRIPGKFALYVDSDEMEGIFKVRGFNCSAHKFPLDARNPFRVSTYETAKNLFESIDLVEQPLTNEQLSYENYDGIILIEADDLDVKISVIPGFFSGEIAAEVEIVANIVVNSFDGRVLGTSVVAERDAMHPSGTACSGGAIALGEATNSTLEEAMKRIGEKLSNSTKVRELSSHTPKKKKNKVASSVEEKALEIKRLLELGLITEEEAAEKRLQILNEI